MVYKHKYSWRNVVFPVKADEAAEEISRIQNKYGEVTPKLLLEESRDDGAVLHKCYEWDDTKAAEKWRIQQSRLIMSCLTVTYEDTDLDAGEVKKIEVRVFQNVSDEKDGAFVHVRDAMQTGAYRDAVLRRAINELTAFRKKYADLSELSKLFEVVDEIEVAL